MDDLTKRGIRMHYNQCVKDMEDARANHTMTKHLRDRAEEQCRKATADEEAARFALNDAESDYLEAKEEWDALEREDQAQKVVA